MFPPLTVVRRHFSETLKRLQICTFLFIPCHTYTPKDAPCLSSSSFQKRSARQTQHGFPSSGHRDGEEDADEDGEGDGDRKLDRNAGGDGRGDREEEETQ